MQLCKCVFFYSYRIFFPLLQVRFILAEFYCFPSSSQLIAPVEVTVGQPAHRHRYQTTGGEAGGRPVRAASLGTHR